MHIRKNDLVIVSAGKDKGKKAKVLIVYPEKSRALVEGINYVKKYERKSQKNQQGGMVQKEMPIHVSNLSIVCPKCNVAVRTGVTKLADGTKTRICRKCQEAV